MHVQIHISPKASITTNLYKSILYYFLDTLYIRTGFIGRLGESVLAAPATSDEGAGAAAPSARPFPFCLSVVPAECTPTPSESGAAEGDWCGASGGRGAPTPSLNSQSISGSHSSVIRRYIRLRTSYPPTVGGARRVVMTTPPLSRSSNRWCANWEFLRIVVNTQYSLYM